MAFAYRTPAQLLLSSLNSENQEKITGYAVKKLTYQEKSSSLNYSYALTDDQREFCFSVGINLSVNPFVAHPHPYCKTMENFLLFDNVSNYVNKIDIYVSMKDCKFQALTKNRHSSPCKLLNRIVADRDRIRYESNVGRIDVERLASLGDQDKSWFFHDEIHHWPLNDLLDFLKKAKPRRVLATIVVPIEIFECDNSMNPSFYDFEVIKRKKSHCEFIFFPDGSRESAYYQKTSDFWFKYSHLTINGEVYTVSFLRSIKCHHLILIEHGNLCANPYYISDGAECINSKIFGFSRSSKIFLPIRFKVFKSELIYLFSVKKPDPNSAAAKLRQLSNEGYKGAELNFFLTLSGIISRASGCFKDVNFAKCIWEALTSVFPERIQNKICSSYIERKIEKFILEAEPFYVKFKRVRYPQEVSQWVSSIHDSIDPSYVIENLDKLTNSNTTENIDTSYSIEGEYQIASVSELNALRECCVNRKKVKDIEKEVRELEEGNGNEVFFSAEEVRFEMSKGGKSGFQKFRMSRKHRTFSAVAPKLLICDYSFNEKFTPEHQDRVAMEKKKRVKEIEMEEVEMDCEDDHDQIFFSDGGESSYNEGDREKEKLQKEGGEETVSEFDFQVVELEKHLEDQEKGPQDGEKELAKKGLGAEEGEMKLEIIEDADGYLMASDDLMDMIEEGFETPHVYTKNKGRKVLFFSDIADLTYGFGSHEYKNCNLDFAACILEIINEKFKFKFNTILMQKYSEGEGVGLHKDDEKVYDDDQILTWNVSGECDFDLESKKGLSSVHLKKGYWLMMAEGAQKESRHGVRNCTEGRISFTFRKQKRYMNGKAIDGQEKRLKTRELPDNLNEMLEKMSNACFIDALCDHMSSNRARVFTLLYSIDEAWLDKVIADKGAEVNEMIDALTALEIPGTILSNGVRIEYLREGSFKPIYLVAEKGHVRTEEMSRFQPSVVSENVENFLKTSGCGLIKPKFSVERARRLVRSMQEGATGVLLNKFKHAFNELRPAINKVYTVAGFAGSGKSRCIQNLLVGIGNRKTTILCSPRRDLLNDWESKIKRGLSGREMKCKLRTFESAVKNIQSLRNKGDKGLIVIDEVSLLPGGYLDMINSLTTEGSIIILIFDPCQASYFSRSDSGRNLGDVFEPIYGCEYPYLYRTFRFKNVQNFEDLESNCKLEVDENHMKFFGQPEAVRAKIKNPVFLCPSEEKREELKRYGEAYTFGCSQGLTFDFVIISLDMDGPLVSNAQWMVALTRSRRGFAFLSCASIRKQEFMQKTEGKLIRKILEGSKVSKQFIHCLGGRALEKAKFLSDMESFGRTREEFENCLEGDPWLKSQLLFLESSELEDIEVEEPVRKESPPRTHLMHASDALIYIEGAQKIKAREIREFRNDKIWSNQFDDCEKKRESFNNRAETFEAIYPRHTNSDSLTLWAAIKKRLSFSDPNSERRRLERVMSTGQSLFDIFQQEFKLKRGCRVDEEQIGAEFIEKRLAKSRALIEAHAERSDPDWPVNYFFLFMKTQLCTKFEKRFTEAKAGQTLACFSHRVLTRFGVPIRIAERKMRSQLRDNIYIHSGKQLDELNEWCIKYAEDTGTDSDYEAFDRSQDALILAFEIHLLRFFDWEEDLIQDYITIKLNLGCRLGNLAIMRFTGEFGTFFLNTCCNMLFTCLRYHLTEKTPLAFAGDDMFSPGKLEIRKNREFLLNRFSLKAKVNFSREPMFCGWRMTRFGIVKEPKLVLERFKIAKEKGIFKECLINYCLEVSFAYRLGERLLDVIKNIEDFQALVRIVVKNKHLLPKKVRKEFESFDHEFGGCESVPEEGECNRVHRFGCGLECNI